MGVLVMGRDVMDGQCQKLKGSRYCVASLIRQSSEFRSLVCRRCLRSMHGMRSMTRKRTDEEEGAYTVGWNLAELGHTDMQDLFIDRPVLRQAYEEGRADGAAWLKERNEEDSLPPRAVSSRPSDG